MADALLTFCSKWSISIRDDFTISSVFYASLPLFRNATTPIKNVEMDDQVVAKYAIASNGVGPCWIILAFLSGNYIYLDHNPMMKTKNRVNDRKAIDALQSFLETLQGETGSLEIVQGKGNVHLESVCLFGSRCANDALI